MSLATRCTHCGTIFKVVQDQLKVSEGWVRCGRCNEVFNALPSLFDLEKDPPPPRPAHAPPPAPLPEPPEPPAPSSLVQQGLMDQPEVDLGEVSHTPDDWARTEPAGAAPAAADEASLALDPEPVPDLEATTDFELDTAIAVDDNTPLEDVIASVTRQTALRQIASQPEPDTGRQEPHFAPADEHVTEAEIEPHPDRPWLQEPPQDVPTTDEEDALDSRYLMPSDRVRKAPARRQSGPEFADAEFPTDAFMDDESAWAPAPSSAPSLRGLSEAIAPALKAASPEPTAPPASPEPGQPQTDASPTRPAGRKKSRPPKVPAGPNEAVPEFLRQAQRQAFWRHPATRVVLSMLALVLLLALGLQVTHQFRDLIAAYHPESRPLLSRWCALAHCQLAPPLRLEDLQVDSVELVRTSSEGPDSYRLAVVVHNKSTIDLAWPDVDLALTDESGAVIARRVFSPNDAHWFDTADTKAQGAAHAASAPLAAPSQRSTTLQWRLRMRDIKPAGYTAELFYP